MTEDVFVICPSLHYSRYFWSLYAFDAIRGWIQVTCMVGGPLLRLITRLRARACSAGDGTWKSCL